LAAFFVSELPMAEVHGFASGATPRVVKIHFVSGRRSHVFWSSSLFLFIPCCDLILVTQQIPLTTINGEKMLITNIETIPGAKVVKHLGLVQGSTVRAKHIGRDLMAGLKNIVGGELKGYTELLEDSRKQATERMIRQAESIGANAIVNVRFSTSSVAQGAAELYVYGTAVILEDVSGSLE
jgi:uncharacterized protein YbjQ (UPF0145 family)